MAFNPALPQTNSEVSSAEMRAQFNGLNDLIGNRTTVEDVNNLIVTNAAGPLNGLALLDLPISDPPTQAEVTAIVSKINDLIQLLNRD